ncbi:peptidoglycan-binding protein [Streptomyces sp. NBC_01207]|uniref:peptidoglycan-binding protein n=1 Tax=Streptomyces sp. NBC_01207 TaxID=2903772 RepID=UPI002E124D9F|nr:peptidoglycan-binding protein [Streptomyces sp. NBC_01207]
MLAAAAADVGYKEGPDNDTKHGRWYGLNYNPWCDMAISYWAQQSENAGAVGRFAYCPSHVNWFRARGQWLDKNAAARRGDIVFYSWDGGPAADHVGIVAEDSDPGQSLATIEGNTSSGNSGSQGNGDGCYRRTRPRTYVLGFGRPAYSGSSSGGDSGPSRAQSSIGGLTYGYGAHGDHVTRIGRALVARGFGSHYAEGPGPDWSDADTLNYAAFQRSLGYNGSDADGVPGPDSLARLLGSTLGTQTYAPFPGTDWFKSAPRSPLVTAMGRRLVAEGCGRYADGPGPQWTDADRQSYAAWQRRQGFGGTDADGWPGQRTWDALQVPAV